MGSPVAKEGGAPAAQVSEARAVAGRLLTRRAHTESEVRDRLSQGGFDLETIDATIQWLCDHKLVDDAEFARIWVEERAARKGFGPARLRSELEAKGIAGELVDLALAELGDDEHENAQAIALAQLDRLAGLPLVAQARRLEGLLLRRGFSVEAVRAATRAVLPPDGWD
jgi:regulatory protein